MQALLYLCGMQLSVPHYHFLITISSFHFLIIVISFLTILFLLSEVTALDCSKWYTS